MTRYRLPAPAWAVHSIMSALYRAAGLGGPADLEISNVVSTLCHARFQVQA